MNCRVREKYGSGARRGNPGVSLRSWLLPLFGLLAAGTPTLAITKTWLGSTTAWTTASNWDPNGVPGPADDVVFNSGSIGVTLAAPVTVRSVTMTSGYTGPFNLGGFILTVDGGDADFRSGGTLPNAGISTVLIRGSTAQYLHGRVTGTLPHVVYDGTGTLQLASNNVSATSYVQLGGTLNLAGYNLSTTGDFIIHNGRSATVTGLGGRTLAVGGKAVLMGSWNDFLTLDPGSAWSLTVTGSTYADFANIGNCTAGGTPLMAFRSTDYGGNSGVNFPPDVYHWNRSSVVTAGAFEASYNWTIGMEGSGLPPPSSGDDDFTTDGLGDWTFRDFTSYAGAAHSLTDRQDQLRLVGHGLGVNSTNNAWTGITRMSPTPDFDVSVKLLHNAGASTGSAGLLAMDDPASPSLGGYCVVSRNPNGDLVFQRDGDGNGTLETASAAVNVMGPVWLRLARNGTSFSAFYRTSPAAPWTQLGTATTLSSAATYSSLGLYHTSGSNSIAGEAVFDDFHAGGPLNAGLALSLGGTGANADAGATLGSHTSVGSVDFTGYSGSFSFGAYTLTVSNGNVTFSGGMSLSPGSGTLKFTSASATQILTPRNGSLHPALQKDNAGTLRIVSNNLNCAAYTQNGGVLEFGAGPLTLTTSGSFNLNGGTVNLTTNGATLAVGSNLAMIGGTLSAGGGSLDVDFNFVQTGGTTTAPASNPFTVGGGFSCYNTCSFNPNGGTVTLNTASAAQDWNNATTLANLTLNGTGGWTPSSAINVSGILTLANGSLNPSTNGVDITAGTLAQTGGTLSGTSANISVGNFSLTGGTFSMPTAGYPKEFHVSGNFSHTAGTFSGAGTIIFNATAAGKTITTTGTYSNFRFDGAGGGWTAGSGWNVSNLDMAAGTVNLGSYSHAFAASTLAGGTLNFGSSTVDMDGPSVDFSGLATVTAGTGILRFTRASSQSFTPKASQTHPHLQAIAAGPVTFTGAVIATGISVLNGTLNLGSALIHTVGSLSGMSSGTGGINFGSSTLKVSGDVDLGPLGSGAITPGTGTLEFTAAAGTQTFTPLPGVSHPAIVHTGAGTLALATNDLACAYFAQSAGTFDFNGRNVTTLSSGNFTVTNGSATTLANLAGRTITVAGNASLAGASSTSRLNLNPGSAWTLSVTGTLSASLASLANNTASAFAGACSDCANGGGNSGWSFAMAWDGGGADAFWSTADNWTADAVPTAEDAVTFNAGSADATLDANRTVRSISFTSGYTGTFSFSSSTLTVNSGNADFRSGGAISAGTGALAFTSATAQTLIPHASSALPAIAQNGAGGTTLATNGLLAASLSVSAGTFDLGSGLVHTLSGGVASSGGGLAFGSSQLRSAGATVDLGGLATLSAGTGTLELTNTSPATFTPRYNIAHPSLLQSGTGATTVSTNDLIAAGIRVSSGTLDFSTNSLDITASGSLQVDGGTLLLANSDVTAAGDLSFTSGTLSCPGSGRTFAIGGNVDYQPATLTHNSGTLTLNSTATGRSLNVVGSGLNNLSITGAGSSWTLAAPLNIMGNLTLAAGTLDLTTNGHDLAAGGLLVSGGTLTATGASLDINGDVSLTSGLLACPGSGETFTVSGSMGQSGGTLSPGTGTVTLDGTAAGKNLDVTSAFNNLTLNGTGGVWTAVNDVMVSGTFTLAAGGLDLSANIRTLVAGAYSQTGGTLTAGTGNVDVNGGFSQTGGTFTAPGSARQFTVDGSFTQTGGTFTPGTGTLILDGSGTSLVLNAATNLNALNITGPGEWTVTSNGLNTNDLSLANGTLKLGSGLTHALTYAPTLSSGTLDFGSSTLQVGTSIGFQNLAAVVAGTGTLEFMGTGAKSLTPKNGAAHPALKVTGSGTVTLVTYGLNTSAVDVNAGALDIGSLTLATAGNLTVAGGTLAAASGTLDVNGNLVATSGTLDLPGGAANVAGNLQIAAAVNLGHNSGTVSLDGTASGRTVDAPGTLHTLSVANTGSWTVVNNGLDLQGALVVNAGTLDLGALSHTVNGVSGTGILDFGTANLYVASGNADFSGLSSLLASASSKVWFTAASGVQTLTPLSGSTLPHVAHTGAGELELSAYDLECLGFTQNAGTLDFNGRNISTPGNLGISNGTASSLVGLAGRTLTVGGNASLSGSSGVGRLNLNPGAAWSLNVSGTASAQYATVRNAVSTGYATVVCTHCGNEGTNANWTFAVAWDGGGGDSFWGTAANWSSDVVPTAEEAVTFDAGSLPAALGADATAKSITFTSGYTGAFSFGSYTLTIAGGDADFRSGGGIVPASGTLRMAGAAPQVLIPRPANPLPNLVQDGTGGTTLSTNGMYLADVSIVSGTLNLGAGLEHDVASITGSGGGLDFGSSILRTRGATINLSGIGTVTPGSGTLEFVHTGAQTYTPKAGLTTLKLTQSGAGTTTFAADVTTDLLTISAGTVALGTTRQHAATALAITGGALDFGSASRLTVSAATVDLSNLASLTPGTGALRLSSASAQSLVPHASATHPQIEKQGAGTLTITTRGLTSGAVIAFGGTIHFGAGLTHTVASLSDGGGGPYGSYDFGSSTVNVSGSVGLSMCPSVTAGTGTLVFTAPTGVQNFTPKASTTHPAVSHTGAGTMRLYTNDLQCRSFAQSDGTLDLNGRNLATVASGDLSITGGASALAGLAGRTLTVAGNATFTGIGPGDPINLNPGSAWTVNAAGTLAASRASLAYSAATGSPGGCANCADGGNNTGWSAFITWDGGGADDNWSTPGNWGLDAVPTSADNVVFDATSVKNVALNTIGNVSSVTFKAGYTGVFDFGSQSLNVYGAAADFRSGGTFTPGSGLVYFLGSGAQTLIPPASGSLPGLQRTSTGTVTISTNPYAGPFILIPNGTINLGAGLTHVVQGIDGNATGTLDFGTSHVEVTSGTVDFADLAVTAAGSNTLTFKGTGSMIYVPRPALTSLSLAHTGTGTTTVMVNDFIAPSLTLAAGTFQLGTGRSHSLGAFTGTGGTLDFGSSSLAFSGSTLDLGSLAGVSAGTGTLVFNSGTAQTFVPRAGSTHPALTLGGAGGVTLATNALTAGALTLTQGDLDLGNGFIHTVGSVSASGGGLVFGSSTLRAAGATVDLSGVNTLNYGTGVLAFTGAAAQTFTPKSGVMHPAIVQNGAGGTTVATNNFTTGALTISAGTFDLGTGRSIGTTAFTATGGGLAFGSSTLEIGAATVDLSGLTTLAAGTGTLSLWRGAAQTFIPKAATTHPALTKGGTGTLTLATNGLLAGALTVNDGSLSLGAGLTHGVASVGGTGTLDFGSSVLEVTGDAALGGLAGVTPGSGTLRFTAGTGVQSFTPRNGATHPIIEHTGAGELELNTNDLACLGFSQSAGSLDFNGRDLSTTSGGGFTLTNGAASTLVGLAGRTLTVAGDANLAGASSASRLNLNPGAAWTLAVSGSLTASLASLAYGSATGSAGTCGNCANLGSNSGWTFAVTWDGGGADANWSTAANWGSDAVPTADDAVTFDGTSDDDATLDANVSIRSIAFTADYDGAFSFGAYTLTVNTGNADFRSGGVLSAGTGTLAFTSSSAQTLIPHSGATLPAITQNGAGGTTVATHALASGNLTVTSGAFALGAGLTHTVGAISGAGTLDFGTSNLNATGNADLSGLTVTATSSNTLAFTGAAARTFTPKASLTSLRLTQNGAGGTTVVGAGFTTPLLTLSAGPFALGSGLAHSVGGLAVSGGSLDFGASTLDVTSGGVDLSALTAVTAGTGTLRFSGSSTQAFTPRAGATHPGIAAAGPGGLVLTAALTAGPLAISAGTVALGSGLTHVFSSLGSTGGSLDFGSSTLQVSGNTDFSALTTLTGGTGALDFTAANGTQVFTPLEGVVHPAITHSGAGTLQLAANALRCLAFVQTAGTLDLNGRDLETTAGDLTVTGGTSASFANLDGRTLSVAGNAFLAGTSGDRLNLDPASAWTLAVAGTLTAQLATLANCAASLTAGEASASTDGGGNTGWTFFQTWDGGGADDNWTTAGNWDGDALPVASSRVRFDGTSAKNCVLDAAATVGSIAFTAGYTGNFAFSTNTLNVTGDADFRSGGAFTVGSGSLVFAGPAPQTFVPKAGAVFPSLVQNGAGGTTLSTQDGTAASLGVLAGTFNLGAGRTLALGSVSTSGGGLAFGTGVLQATGNVDLSGLATLSPDAGLLELTGASAQAFTPKAGSAHPRIAKTGTGPVSIAGAAGFSTAALRLAAGSLSLGSGIEITVTDTLAATGGALDFGSATLKTAAASPTLAGLASLTPGTGTLEFTGASAQTFTPMASSLHPALVQSGAGGTTVATNGLLAGSVLLSGGVLSLGTGLSHEFAGIGGAGGGLDFGSSTLSVTGDADLSGLATLIAGSGTLRLARAAGTQVFTPRNGSVHPLVVHDAAGTAQLSTNSLSAQGLTHSAGAFDFNGLDATLTGTGNLTVTAPVAGLGGRTLTVGGNARFAGTAGAPLALDPGTAWTVAVTGALSASNVRLARSAATASPGVADSSADLGLNTGWTFLDTVPPANVTGFVATALGGNAAALAWTASASADADSVMLRYRTDGTSPTSRTDGTLWRAVAASRAADTASGLSDKTVYHFAAFVKDSSGNWSAASAAAGDSARLPDVTPPANVMDLVAEAVDPTTVVLAWDSPADADADSLAVRYRAGEVPPADAADGTLWRRLPVSAAGDTVTGLSTNTVYAFGLFVRDSSGNWSPAAAGAQDTALWQQPVTGTLAIGDLSGRTRDADPALAFTWSGADSVRFSLLADTAAAAWRTVRALDSLALGADGIKVVAAQFKNAFGRRSAWLRDTTVLDRVAPQVSLDLETVHGRWTWPAALTGKSRDPLAGNDRVYLVRRRLSDGMHYNGAGWVPGPDTARLVLGAADSLFSAPMPAGAMATGDYAFTAWAGDLAGNVGAPLTVNVHYEENRAPQTAASDVPDTLLQNAPAAWTLDFGDLDAGDSLSVVSVDAPAWLTATPGPDTAWAPWSLHKVFKLAGKPGQAHVGANTVQVRVQDRGGLILTHARTFQVRDVNDAPVFADSQGTVAAREDETTKWTPRFQDPDPEDNHTLALLQAPAFARVEGFDLVLKPGSRDVGDHPLRLTVGDGALLDTLDAVLKVANVNDPPYAFPSAGFKSPAFWLEDRVDTFTVVVVDMDRGDPVTLATPLPSFVKVTQSVDSSGYNRTFRFVVSPTGADTGALDAALTFVDAAGATSRLALVGRVQPDNDVPTASITESRTHAGAARFRLAVSDEDGSLEKARFHYRLVGPAGDTVRRGITSSDVLALHPLADGPYTLAVMAEDQDGLRQPAFTTAAFTVRGATTLSLDTARWHMIGAPQAQLPAAALGAGATLASWDETGDDGQPLSRYASGRAVDALKRGKGYWVRLAQPATVSAAQKDLPTGAFALRLTRSRQGWNQVANPFPYFVDVSASRLTFWEWDAEKRDLVNARGLLKPWAAYWVLAPRDTTLLIADAPWFPEAAGALAKASASGSAGAAPAGPSFRGREAWSLQLALRAGAYHDEANLLGVGVPGHPGTKAPSSADPGAEAAALALPDAPKFGDYVALHFERAAGPADASAPVTGLASDFRAALDPEEEWWDFSLENRGTGEERARLSLKDLEPLLSAGLKVFLVRRGEAREVEPGADAVLALEGERTHYSLVVTPHADFAGRLKGAFALSQNFPNPVSTHTTFRFVLPQSWDADGKRVNKDFNLRINLYDYAGRRVAEVASGTFRPGAHNLLWKARTASGSRLAKGAYVYRLETRGFVRSLKLLVE